MFESKETILSVEAMLTVTISFMEDKESPPLNTITDGMQVPSEGSTCKAKYNKINSFNSFYLPIIGQLRFFRNLGIIYHLYAHSYIIQIPRTKC